MKIDRIDYVRASTGSAVSTDGSIEQHDAADFDVSSRGTLLESQVKNAAKDRMTNRHRVNKAAASRSIYKVAAGWVRRIEAGHAVVIAPSKVVLTAGALRDPGTVQKRRAPASSAGTVSVMARGGTAANAGKQPSLTC